MLYAATESQKKYFRITGSLIRIAPELAIYLKHYREKKIMLHNNCEQCQYAKYALAAYGNRAQALLCLACGDHDLIF